MGLKDGRRAMVEGAAQRISLDEFYKRTFVRVGYAFATALRWMDENIVDGLVNAVGIMVAQSAAVLRLSQSSFVRGYALAMAVGGAMVLAYFLAG